MMKDPLFDPSCCSYKLDGETRSQIEDLITSSDIDKHTKSNLRSLMDLDESNKNTLSYDSLAKLHKFLQRANPDKYLYPFYHFLERCKCIEPVPRNSTTLEARLRQLRLQHSKKLYDSMVSSVDRRLESRMGDKSAIDTESVSKELRFYNGSLIAVFNSFLVYICTFIFCYKALEYSLNEPNIIGQTLFGLFGSTVVACAELYFLARVI